MTEFTVAVRSVAAAIRRKARNSALINGAICIAGLVVTLGTLSSASKSGGTYFVVWGAIVFGFYGCVRAIVRFARAEEEAMSFVAAHAQLSGRQSS